MTKKTLRPGLTINVTKPTNPKDAIGTEKLPMHLIPGSAKATMALAFLEGALKYGKYNWRVAGVRASIYLDAMERHLEKFKNHRRGAVRKAQRRPPANGSGLRPDRQPRHMCETLAVGICGSRPAPVYD
jgi:hypothetical protein